MPFRFEDRVVEYPNRVKLTPVAGQANTYDVERSEGIILDPGTPLTAANIMKLQEYSNTAGLALEAEKASGYTKGGAIDMALRDLFKRRDTAVYAFEAEQAQVARDYSNGGRIYRRFYGLDDSIRDINVTLDGLDDRFKPKDWIPPAKTNGTWYSSSYLYGTTDLKKPYLAFSFEGVRLGAKFGNSFSAQGGDSYKFYWVFVYFTEISRSGNTVSVRGYYAGILTNGQVAGGLLAQSVTATTSPYANQAGIQLLGAGSITRLTA